MAKGIQASAAILLAGLLAWAPLPYASNRGWSWSLLAGGLAVVLVLAGAAQLTAKRQDKLPWVVVPAAFLTAAVWAAAWAQTLPVDDLPTFAGWLRAHPFWSEVTAFGLAPTPSAGLGVEAGRNALMRLLAYGAVFWAAVLLLRDRAWARRFLLGFVIVATVYALYGLLNQLAGWDTVLWEGEPKAYSGYVTSTFINRNSYATYANLGILTALGLLLEPFLAARGAADLRRLAGEAMEKVLQKQGPLLVAIVVQVAAMLLTGSRGGFLSIIAALIAFGLITFAATRPRLPVALGVVAATALVGWGVVWIAGDMVVQRLSEIEGTGEGRTMIWSDTLNMIAARPESGHGYGTYAHSFPLFQAESAGPLMVDLAHDTYLQHAAELGVPVTVMLYAGPLLMFFYCVRGVLIRRRDQVFALVAATATVLVAVHALVDFSLQIPAVAVTYAALLGIGVVQSRSSTPSQQHGASLRE